MIAFVEFKTEDGKPFAVRLDRITRIVAWRSYTDLRAGVFKVDVAPGCSLFEDGSDTPFHLAGTYEENKALLDAAMKSWTSPRWMVPMEAK